MSPPPLVRLIGCTATELASCVGQIPSSSYHKSHPMPSPSASLTYAGLAFRSLRHYRRVNLAVILGVAIGAAVLTGALIVGDSVRGSLRTLTLQRLGNISHALVTDRFFREDLASHLAERLQAEVAPTLLTRGTVESSEGARASNVQVQGVDERFWQLFGSEIQPQRRRAWISSSLAREIGAAEGDSIIVRLQADSLIPAESVLGRKSDTVRTVRTTVAGVLPDDGPGRFGLAPSQQEPFNVFMPLADAQRIIGQVGRANALLAASEGLAPQTLAESLRATLTLDDYALSLDTLSDGLVALATERVVLEQATAEAAQAAADTLGIPTTEVLTYLANEIRIGDAAIPYSTVSALSGPDDLAAASSSAPAIALNAWAANDLGAKSGDPVHLSYFTPTLDAGLATSEQEFTLIATLPMSGPAIDRDLAPEFEGMSNADRMGDWDPPFPVDLRKIRDQDEDYWDQYRTAPKAFIPLAVAKDLWTSRFGQLTSIRFALAEATGKPALESALLSALDPAAHGLRFEPVREKGLAASQGATDFSGLFIGFSFFLILAASLLVALLFRLSVEQRAPEAGLMAASGHTYKAMRGILLREGTLLAGLGVVLGLPLAAAYAAVMIYGLNNWWSAAIGGSFLRFHAAPTSFVTGALVAFVLMIVSIWFGLRQLRKSSPRALLAGTLEEDRAGATGGNRTKWIAAAAIVTALGLAAAAAAGAIPALAAFGGVGFLLLIGLLAAFRVYYLGGRTPVSGALSLGALARRNGARYPTRSALAVALVAFAAFLIVAVSSNRHDLSRTEPAFDSGDGGFRFVAQSSAAIFPAQLEETNLDPASGLYPFRVKSGEDASCLNLYQPTEPTFLGAPPELIARGGFAFAASLAESSAEIANPWQLLESRRDGAIPVFGDQNSVMWILHKQLGDTLEITDDRGQTQTLVIAGVLTRSLFQSELVMSAEHFRELFPDRGGYRYFLRESDDEGAGAELEQAFADSGMDATTTAGKLAGFLAVENTYLSTFQTLGGLGLLLGTLGLAIVMLRSVLDRRAELALLRAVGLPGESLSQLVLAENAFLLIAGIVIGAATALIAVGPHLLSTQADTPWVSLLLLLGAVLITGLVAGAWAARASSRGPVVAALRRD